MRPEFCGSEKNSEERVGVRFASADSMCVASVTSATLQGVTDEEKINLMTPLLLGESITYRHYA